MRRYRALVAFFLRPPPPPPHRSGTGVSLGVNLNLGRLATLYVVHAPFFWRSRPDDLLTPTVGRAYPMVSSRFAKLPHTPAERSGLRTPLDPPPTRAAIA